MLIENRVTAIADKQVNSVDSAIKNALSKLVSFRDSKDTQCKRGKVAAAIITKPQNQNGNVFRFTTVSVSLNSGIVDSLCTEEEGKCGCVHAETRALIRALSRYNYQDHHILLSTVLPCVYCATHIVEAGFITEVHYITHNSRYIRGLEILKSNHKLVTQHEI